MKGMRLMITKSQAKRKQDIKTKLMAAIAMLLVSSIMMVSSTYAWFTLSTAPEVTGITTAVGANGNLEMALMPTDGQLNSITSATGDSMAVKSKNLANVTWGNLVDLSQNDIYGLDKIQLYPAKINGTNGANGNLESFGSLMLQTPVYGADGRVSQLNANTVTSTYVDGKFPVNALYGVRAVGVASGMTDRQLAYRNALSAASTATSQAKSEATASLNRNGSSLANVALKKATNDAPTFDQTDVAALKAIVSDLLGTETQKGVLEYIEEAYVQYIYAYASSKSTQTGDTPDATYLAVKAIVDGTGKAAEKLATLETYLPTANSYIDAIQATRAQVESAKTDLDALTGTEISWSDISTPLNKLANPQKMKLNTYTMDEVKANMSNIINSVASQGVNVEISTGGGVYADVADHCGNFTASITIAEVTYGGLTLNNMNARMNTVTTVGTTYLSATSVAANAGGSPDGSGTQVMPISEMYGYVIDLAFRTNAAESKLLLQTEAAGRIYDSGSSEETMGHGSTMTFTATASDFTSEQVAELMESIRIVFFTPGTDNNTVLATAKLDMGAKEDGADGMSVTAPIKIYTEATVAETTKEYVLAEYIADAAATETNGYRKITGNEVATHALIDGTYVAATHVKVTTTPENGGEATTTYEVAAGGQTPQYAEKTTTTAMGGGYKTGTDAVITALTQNQAQAVSVLVYLDGESITNADVAATATTSVTGSMNLQFASSANLVPMNYANLQTPAQGSGNTTGGTDNTNTPAQGGTTG